MGVGAGWLEVAGGASAPGSPVESRIVSDDDDEHAVSIATSTARDPW